MGHGLEVLTIMKSFLLFLLVFVPVLSGAAERSKPNVILIYADDLGIGMLGSYGQTLIKTPHIDRLASEGMKFTNYYGGVFCAPSRWTLLTGMHDGRPGGWSQTPGGLAIARDDGRITEAEYEKRFATLKEKSLKIPENEIFLAQIAQKAGYKTAQFGKLDNGFLTWNEKVRRYGWDFHEGYYDHVRCHGFYPPYLWRNGVRFDLPGNTSPNCGRTSEGGHESLDFGGETYSQNVFIKGILKFIRDHKDEPFFLYHPTQLPHGPVAIPEIHPDFVEMESLSFAEKKYASMVKMLDEHVGLIMKELKILGLDENTLVAFTSDNGHELYYGPKPEYKKQLLSNGEKANLTDKKWRSSEQGDVFDGNAGRAGLKRSAYQGGMQCPMIVRWPRKIEAGTETKHLSAHYDFMATLGDLLGVEVPQGKDSLSYLPVLLGQPQEKRHDYVVVSNRFRQMGRRALIANDGMKLVEIESDKYQLFDLNKDNEERVDLAAKHPKRVKELGEILKREHSATRPDLQGE